MVDPKDVNPYDIRQVRRLMKARQPKKPRKDPKDINPYETRRE